MENVTRPPGPDHLTMNLFAPGMTALHRAGLGGLACTLKAMERQYEAGLLRKDKLPAPLDHDALPWVIGEQTVTLRFEKPENAGEYLKKLFAFGFQLRDGLIYLPGQYSDPPPSLATRAELQAGLTLTFLQHGKTRRLKQATVYAPCSAACSPPGSSYSPVTSRPPSRPGACSPTVKNVFRLRCSLALTWKAEPLIAFVRRSVRHLRQRKFLAPAIFGCLVSTVRSSARTAAL